MAESGTDRVMTLAATTGFTNAPLWFTTRSTAIIAFVLLTLATVLGVAGALRPMASRGWPRFATHNLHRNLSLLGLGFVCAHVLTTVLDSYVTVSWWSMLVPGTSSYRRFWVSLGTLAFDIVLVVIGTSLLRSRIQARTWRAVHWASYALWPLALIHFLTTGTDAAHGRWGLWLGLTCLAAVAAAVGTRLVVPNQPQPLRSVAEISR
jgi:sulfoxide reductase heme-binding subunit YedZ